MKISLLNTEYSKEDYNVYIKTNGEKYTYGSYKNADIKKGSIVELIIENQVLSSKYGVIVILFYWVCSILSGTADKEPFGRPYTLKLKLKVLEESDIVIRVNEYKEDKPFSVLAGDIEILRNEFVLEKAIKTKWIWGAAIPPIIVVTLINILFLCIGIQGQGGFSVLGYILFLVFGVIEVYFCVRSYKVLKRR